MPLYSFILEDDSIIELNFPMATAPSWGEIITLEDGRKAKRIVEAPSINTNPLNPFSTQSCLEKFAKEEKTIGDTVDRAKILSEERASKSADGIDPVKRAYFEKYKSMRNGARHPEDNITPQKTLTYKEVKEKTRDLK